MTDSDENDAPGADETWSRRSFLKGVGAVGVAAPVVLSGCSDDGKSSTASGSDRRRKGDDRVNFIVILADDMRFDQMPFVPNVQKHIVDHGRSFVQARCNVPLCQPSRVGMMTGQTSKHNNVINVGFDGVKIDQSKFIAKALADAGYTCALIGKYLNGIDAWGGTDPPPGFSFWRENIEREKDGRFTVRAETKTLKPKGIYPTDFWAKATDKFLGETKEPFALWVATSEPHAPFTPRADLAKRFSDFDFEVVNEEDVSDKPPWVQALPPLSDAEIAKIQEDVRGSLRELTAVDEMVGKIMESIDPEVLARTVVVFASDNGVHRGEHRRRGAGSKSGPYDVGLRVPMIVRGPGFEHGEDVTVPTLAFQDLVATMVELSGAKPLLPHQDGISMTKLVGDPDAHRQRVLLHEIADPYFGVTGDGMTTGPDHDLGFRKLYRYPSKRSGDKTPPIYEAYDLDTDPDELSNWADDPARRAERDRLEAMLDDLLA